MSKKYLKVLSAAVLLSLVFSLAPSFGLFFSNGKAFAQTLSVTLSASPSSGSAPLNNVDLTANVSGTATGNITYKFDCTSNGTWEKTITTSNTTYTAVDLCSYPNPGSYTAKVRVERDGLSFEGTVAISVQQSAVLTDIKVSNSEVEDSDGPITIRPGGSIVLSWTSSSANSCTASGDWSGSKATAGNYLIGLNQLILIKTYAFTITCTNSISGQSKSDSVQVIVSANPPTVITKPAVQTL
jgi:hypothetical protein